MKTEQVSDGGCDEHGGSVDVAGAAIPMQKIETGKLRDAIICITKNLKQGVLFILCGSGDHRLICLRVIREQ